MITNKTCFYVNVHLKYPKTEDIVPQQILFITDKIVSNHPTHVIYFIGDFNTDIRTLKLIEIPGFKYVIMPSPDVVSSLGGNNEGNRNSEQVDFMFKLLKI